MLCALGAGRCASGAQFVPLGHLPGAGHSSQATDVSADGSIVVGWSARTGIYQFEGGAFRWTSDGGMVGLGDGRLPTGVSADGSVVVGSAYLGGGAFRWTSDGGMVGIGTPPGGGFAVGVHASEVSADGSVVVGVRQTATGSTAFRWTAAGGMIELGNVPGVTGVASGVSADGSVVVGWRDSGYQHAIRWTSGGGIISLGGLPGGDSRGQAAAVSADGSVVVGWSSSGDADAEAFRWTNAGGMIGLVDARAGSRRSFANDVSADGSVVVGWRDSASGPGAFVWDPTHGMRSVNGVLTTLGVDLTGWTLTDATAISADGTTIVGYGFNPSGQMEAWLANINPVPEPSTLALAALAVAGLLASISARRRRNQHTGR